MKFPDNGFLQSGERGREKVYQKSDPPLTPPREGKYREGVNRYIFLKEDGPIIFSKIVSPLPQLGEVGRGPLYLFTPKVSPFTCQKD